MSEREPYEERIKSRLNDLPIPNEDQAWQKMKMMLDDDDDDGVVPPIFLRSCMGWGLSILTGLLIVWLVFHPERHLFSKKSGDNQVKEQNENSYSNNQHSSNTIETSQSNKKPDSIPASNAINETPSQNGPYKKPGNEKNLKGSKKVTGVKTSHNTVISNSKTGNPVSLSTGRNETSEKKKSNEKIISTQPHNLFPAKKQSTKKTALKQDKNKPIGETHAEPFLLIHEGSKKPMVSKTEPQPGKNNQNLISKDSTVKDSAKLIVRKADSPVVKKPHVDTTATSALSPVKKHYFSIGIGMYQQLPVAGQQSSPYNLYGRKGSLGDYLPSLYVRYHNSNKWLVHAEFRYGAPQNVKEVAYVNETSTKFDSTGGTVTSTTTTNISTLKKTFYHQIPISFDYFIRPGWSVGGGLMYSKFFSAVSENESHLRNNITQTETVNKKIVQTDSGSDSSSFFTKSEVQLILSSEYTWKRLSGGIRYAKGLQPFIRYTTSTGEVNEEKNQSVNVFIRFRLWKEDNQK